MISLLPVVEKDVCVCVCGGGGGGGGGGGLDLWFQIDK